jgi:hypothetical protein
MADVVSTSIASAFIDLAALVRADRPRAVVDGKELWTTGFHAADGAALVF